MQNPDAVMVRSASMHEMEFNPEACWPLRGPAPASTIFRWTDCSEEGIVVFNTPGANANAVKELVLAALLMTSRKIVDGIEWVTDAQGARGRPAAKLVEKGKSRVCRPGDRAARSWA